MTNTLLASLIMTLKRRHRRISSYAGDTGFALIYTLVIVSVVVISAAAMVTTTTTGIQSSYREQNAEKAVAAAQAGLQYYRALLNQQCSIAGSACTAAGTVFVDGYSDLSSVSGIQQLPSSVVSALSTAVNNNALTGQSGTTCSNAASMLALLPTTSNNNKAAFAACPTNSSTYLSDGFVRISATGYVHGVSRTVIGDLQTTISMLSLNYYTSRETMGSAQVNAAYPARTISLPNVSGISAVTTLVPGLTTLLNSPTVSLGLQTPQVSWAANDPTNNLLSDTVCDKLWYNDPSNATNGSSDTSGRYQIELNRASLNSGWDWGQNGTLGVSGATLSTSLQNTLLSQEPTFTAPCQVALTGGMSFTGPVASQDAFLVSNNTANGSGPVLNSSKNLTGWLTTSSPAAPAGLQYRTFPTVGGQLSGTSTLSGCPANSCLPTLPSTYSLSAVPAATTICTYYGPTRIQVNGSTATITSPMTKSTTNSSDPCYYNSNIGWSVSSPTTYPSPSVAGAGVVGAQVNLANNPVIQVKSVGSSSNWPMTSTTGGLTPAGSTLSTTPIFSVTAPGTLPTFTNSGSSTVSATGTAPGSVTENNSTVSYSQFIKDVQAKLTASPTMDLMAAVKSLVPTSSSNGSSQGQTAYTVTESAPTISTSTVSGSLTGGDTDPLLQQSSGTYSVTKTTATGTTTATLQPVSWGCPSGSSYNSLAGSCMTQPSTRVSSVWNNNGSAFSANAAYNATSYGSTSTTSSTLTSTFPIANDRTTYSTFSADGTSAPGDAYIEGNNSGKLSLVADHDIVITGDLTAAPTGTTINKSSYASAATTLTAGGTTRSSNWGATDLVATNNVRLYHPVQCLASSGLSTTTAGFCPNDLTGLYLGGIYSNSFSMHPSQQYVDITNSNTANRLVDAAVFALNGGFTTDNYNKGTGSTLGNATVVGGVYQHNRGALGEDWEIVTNARTRPSSGYRLQYAYYDLRNASLPYVPSGSSSSGGGSVWTLISTSSMQAGGS